MEATTKKLRAATPLPGRGGVGGEVNIFFAVRMLQPPTPVPPLDGRGVAALRFLPS